MQTTELTALIIDALEDIKALDIVTIDVSARTSITDRMIIASGQSSRQVAALAQNVITRVKENGVRPLGIEGETEGEWALVDLGNVIVHIMLPNVREFYDLEELWQHTARNESHGDA